MFEKSWLDEPDYRFNSLGCRGVGEIGIPALRERSPTLLRYWKPRALSTNHTR